VSAPTAETIGYSYDQDNRLTSGFIGSGTPQYQYGYDPASNLTSITRNGTTQSHSYSTANEIDSGSYDGNGSPTSLEGNTYTWDGANRVLSVTTSLGVTSTFTYNGLGRLVRMVETSNGSTLADHSYLWCGITLCLAHDNTQSGSPVSTEYFPQGATVGGPPYYYVKDALGSVRELIGTNGTVAAQLDYTPYGVQSSVSGTVQSDIGYAGYFSPSGTALDFTLNRAYDPTDARWLNRDPFGELGGLNLYAYAEGDPVLYRDPEGRDPVSAVVGAGIGAAWGLVRGALAGDTGWQLVTDAGAGAATGGLAGLTDGLSLIEGTAADSVLSSGIEAYRQLINGAMHGCLQTNGAEIAFAGAGSVLGDLSGFLAGSAPDGLVQALHYDPGVDGMIQTLVGGNVSGAVSAAPSAIQGAARAGTF
jgi:RHS repeat-associated protein